ncbi:MAG: serine hydrolase domain-containing protein [Candidatus Thorarchaeota archaeon]
MIMTRRAVTKHIALSLCIVFMMLILSLAPIQPIASEEKTEMYLTSSIERPYWPTEDWEVDYPENHGMNSSKLDRVEQTIDQMNYPIDSVLVIRDGYLVYEYYGEGWEANDLHMIQSCTKCVTSTLVGIAIEQGFIESVDSKMMDFFSSWTVQNVDSRKMNITIEHLLTWTDGMEFHEIDYSYDDPMNDLGQMWVSEDAVQYCLDRPMWNDPGESWWVNSGTLIILGGIIELQSGLSILEFADQYLGQSLGIDNVYWAQIRGGEAGGWYHTDGGLYMTPRDFAKFGYLMLNNGTWDGEQLVPEEWVVEATVPRIETGWTWSPSYEMFGYQWWVWPELGIYSAHGHYEQALYVYPAEDMVIVVTGNVPDGAGYPADSLVEYVIIPAIGLDEYLPQGVDMSIVFVSVTGVAVLATTIAFLIIRKKNE